MPIPKRRDDEDRSDFLSRCMADPTMNKEYPENSQRYAVCQQSAKGTQGQQVQDAYYDNTFGSTEELTEDNFVVPNEEDYVSADDVFFEESEIEEFDISVAKPGLWENIRKKKEREGKNYKPAKPGDPDRPTPEQIKRAQSERVEADKPGKDDPRRTPAPKKDQKKGSDRNKPDSAKDPSGKITFSKEVTKQLSNMVKEHNAKGKGQKATLGMLKAVYRRGAGAYSTSHAPKMSRHGWAIARVNAFLTLLRTGRPSNSSYTQDNDLLPKSHPRSSKGDYEDSNRMQVAQLKKMHQQLSLVVKVLDNIPFEFEEWTKDKISKSEHFIETIYDSVFFLEKPEQKPTQPESPVDNSEVEYASEYQGRKVKLNKPFRTPKGPKKFSVYVKNDKGNVVKVNFGSPDMEIKRDDPNRRKSFRARHNCDNPGPRHKARYWSCRQWRASSPVED